MPKLPKFKKARPGTPLKASRLRLRFEQANYVAVQIGHPRESPGWNFHWGHHDFAAQRLCLVQIGLQVIHLDVKRCVMKGFVAQSSDVAGRGIIFAGLDHDGGAGRLHLPSKELGKEVASFCRIAATDFKVYDWAGHKDLLKVKERR